MHLHSITIHPDKYPVRDRYPYNLPIFQKGQTVTFETPVTLFVGENGTGKSTLLDAIARLCHIHIWKDTSRVRYQYNRYEDTFHQSLTVEWASGPVPGSFFGSNIFQHFAELLDEWARSDSGLLDYFGGRSLMTLSHGQSLMAFFKSRYTRKGLYLLDEPETALSPKSQLELLEVISSMSEDGHAQFIIATHSPLLLAHPDSTIYTFDTPLIETIAYEETEHYKLYKDFLIDKGKYLPRNLSHQP